jgi:hypothetical protein
VSVSAYWYPIERVGATLFRPLDRVADFSSLLLYYYSFRSFDGAAVSWLYTVPVQPVNPQVVVGRADEGDVDLPCQRQNFLFNSQPLHPLLI